MKNGVVNIVIAAQILGVLAVITFILSYQQKKRKNIILVNATSSLLYVLQYLLLGAFEGATLDILTMITTVAAQNKDKKFIKRHMAAIIVIMDLAMLAAGLILYKNIFSLFPVAGAIFQTGAFWISDEKTIRVVSFLGVPFWLVYNMVSCAYGSAVGSVLSLISIGVAILRYDIIPNKKTR